MNRLTGRSPAPHERIVVLTAAGADAFGTAQLERLRAAADVSVHLRSEPVRVAELERLLDGATVAGLTPRSSPDLSRPVLEALPASLRGIAVFATGVDFVDLDAAAERGLAIAHLPDYSAATVAEHTLGLMLTLSRRIHLSRDRALGRVPATTSVRGWELGGRTLGVVGAGRIGRRVVRLARAFGMEVMTTDVRLGGIRLEHLLAVSDVVSLHVPLVRDAPPLVGANEIALMKPGAFLVNVSRAGLVDEQAVLAALACGRLAGYGVDDRVRDRASAADIIAEGRIVETSHTAWYSDEALDRGLATWVDNLVALARGRPRNLVAVSPVPLRA